MSIGKRTRYCCIAVIVLGIAVIGHAVVAARGITPHEGSEVNGATRR